MTEKPSCLLAPDRPALHKKAAQLFLESVAAALRERPMAAVAFSGGSTPRMFFETLASAYFLERIDWSHLQVFFVDERCVPPQHAESNFGMAQKALFSKVPIPVGNIHRMMGEMEAPLQAAKAYEDEMKAVFKTKDVPRFDFILLGVGEDGHTASLFPQSETLTETNRWVAAPYVEKLASHRLTLTLPVLNQARRAVFLVSGAGKAEIMRIIHTRDSQEGRLPAQRVRLENGELIWLFDKEAAGRLPDGIRFEAYHIE